MGEVHRLVLTLGAARARAQAATRGDQRAVDAAAAIMAEEITRIGIMHAGFAMTALPHKRIEERVWRREGHKTTLLVESGLTSKETPVGVPYGTVARLILLYLQTEAVRTGSREVALGRSMHAWMSRMGIAVGGKNYRMVAEQSARLSACRLTFLTDLGDGAMYRRNGAFVQDAITLAGLRDEAQAGLWQDHVRLDEGFWQSLREHPVPVREEAVRAIGPRPMAFDVYVWLAYRLHALQRSAPVSWAALHGQFGTGFRAVRQFRPVFRDALAVALAVYPEARVDWNDTGVLLNPSAPAVPRAEAVRLGVA